jgi:membrane-associated phospholipid phosphatase
VERGPASALARLDAELARRARALPHGAAGDAAVAAMSQVADHALGWVLVAALGAALDPRRRRRWLRAGLVVTGTEGASRSVKRAVRRARPELEPLAGVTSPWSFPSSHTATAVAAIPAFDGLLPARALQGWALLTALSRPYLGVHFPSDVLGGAALGALAGRLAG